MVDGLELVAGGVHVYLDLSVCLMEAHVLWTQIHSQPGDLFTYCSGVMSPLCTGLLIGPTGR